MDLLLPITRLQCLTTCSCRVRQDSRDIKPVRDPALRNPALTFAMTGENSNNLMALRRGSKSCCSRAARGPSNQKENLVPSRLALENERPSIRQSSTLMDLSGSKSTCSSDVGSFELPPRLSLPLTVLQRLKLIFLPPQLLKMTALQCSRMATDHILQLGSFDEVWSRMSWGYFPACFSTKIDDALSGQGTLRLSVFSSRVLDGDDFRERGRSLAFPHRT